eukprot:CAMPEP_0171064700 /NCGR_PEP_ID=MMETSP0766_2-20121228/6450_1 /TAXON_ID=439317 /ORGANISM="Gambierdiscus australes, Strain CAWD 149" /LENGTH=163 /DNA_ID=CAMNT_0011520765 /DNA_START=90 /DNA_END=582 /DNA_ORIENTATION=+
MAGVRRPELASYVTLPSVKQALGQQALADSARTAFRAGTPHTPQEAQNQIEEQVGQRNPVDVVEPAVSSHHRIDEEENWQVDFLLRIDQLLVKTEALDLVEVEARLWRDHMVDGHANDRLVRGVLRTVERQRSLTQTHDHPPLLGHEFPGQRCVYSSCEVHGD